jgi:hypothetical protein
LLDFLITTSQFNRPAWAGLIALQFEQDFGVHTKARRKIYHRRRVIEPILAGFLASARLTSPYRRCLLQTQSRRFACAGLNPKTLHHFVNMHDRMPDLSWLSCAYRFGMLPVRRLCLFDLNQKVSASWKCVGVSRRLRPQ